jgi:hypothetical protein
VASTPPFIFPFLVSSSLNNGKCGVRYAPPSQFLHLFTIRDLR